MTGRSYHFRHFPWAKTINLLCANTSSYNEKMFFVPFVIFIILSGFTATHATSVSKASPAGSIQRNVSESNVIISESGISYINQTNQSNNTTDSLTSTLDNKTNPIVDGANHKVKVKHRGVSNTGIAMAPSIAEHSNNATSNSSMTNQNPVASSDANQNQTIATIVNDKSQQTKVVDQKTVAGTAEVVKPNNKGTAAIPVNSSTTTTTTTTPKPTTPEVPKKPMITYAVDDVPGLIQTPKSQIPQKEPVAEDVPDPLLLESIKYEEPKTVHNFLVPMVGVIIIVPLMILLANWAVRRARDHWSKRRYRRMDYLIEDMYNWDHFLIFRSGILWFLLTPITCLSDRTNFRTTRYAIFCCLLNTISYSNDIVSNHK